MCRHRPLHLLLVLALAAGLCVALPGTADAARDYPGRPPAGEPYWGAAVQGNGDPVTRHERRAAATMGVRHTFFGWRHRTKDYLTDIVREDVAAGRIPWVTIKTPPWRDMARGRHDAQIDQLLRALDRVRGPVWLTIHHEPEGGGGVNRPDDPGGPQAHVDMNRRVRQRMEALGTDNIALASILMVWTWDERSGRDPDDWWEPGIYDFIGVDQYVTDESSLLTPTFARVRRWAARRGMDVAVAEWGMRGTDAAAARRVRAWYEHAVRSHRDGRGARVVGLSAYDSDENSPRGGWRLRGGQLREFRRVLRDSDPARGFRDVGAGDRHANAIRRLAAADVTRGCNPPANDRYCPNRHVTRAQMAAFLRRAASLPAARERFADVRSRDWFATDVGALAADDITRGCNPPANDRYCPNRRVTREQMAAFLRRATETREANESFVDVGRRNIFARDIGGIQRRGITRGCNPPANDRYCPNRPVTRAQMASFLVRAFNL